MSARTPEAVAALKAALRQAVRDAPHTEACQFAAASGLDTCSCWKDDAICALADAPDPMAQAREIVDTMEPLSITFSDGDRFECVFLVSDSHLALRRALGMDDSGDE